MDLKNLTKDDIEFINTNVRIMMEYLQPQTNSIVWSWGASDFKATCYKGMAALQFNVNGFLHKGLVYVCYYEGGDYYKVYCVDANGKVVKEQTEVYCDMLTGVIDELVETENDESPEYIAKAQAFANKVFGAMVSGDSDDKTEK